MAAVFNMRLKRGGHVVEIKYNGKLFCGEKGQYLSEVLMQNTAKTEHLCGGKGICKKCTVMVNGKEELSCKYKIEFDITVEDVFKEGIFSVTGVQETENATGNMCLCLDIGTTTLALALVSLDNKSVVKVLTATNPQRVYGADIISRIEYCTKNGIKQLQKTLVAEINSMIEKLNTDFVQCMYVAGNTTMLHTLLGEDCSSIGVAPYKASFLGKRAVDAKDCCIENVGEIVALPSIHAFIGADILAGIGYVGLPCENKYNLLVDLGTNAEIVLFSRNELLCTSAAAGPCFEGANISCGMSAVEGAICSYGKGKIKTIGNKMPIGLCGTGLVDVISTLLSDGAIDETGYMEEDFEITQDIILTQKDIREFQVAKSAVYSGILTLMREKAVDSSDIDTVYISGGFSGALNIESATKTGLLPQELTAKCVAVENSSLLGTIQYALEGKGLVGITENARYFDLSTSSDFSELFIKNMQFNKNG